MIGPGALYLSERGGLALHKLTMAVPVTIAVAVPAIPPVAVVAEGGIVVCLPPFQIAIAYLNPEAGAGLGAVGRILRPAP